MTAEQLQQALGKLREEQGLTKYRLIKDGIFSGITALNNFESGRQTAQLTTVERYLDYLGYRLEVVKK